ncbi:hypothetical protein F2P81_020690 [Scophthalmus maximus]|uniref:Attractin GBD domain-containing protein n=1 Tax=Scophthalmus maximus TaxID=52904 RepID=A0A6A4S5W8_SCOMX|nr:hypothetical protein F2P81_020690 [Scophthalmus maximus]
MTEHFSLSHLYNNLLIDYQFTFSLLQEDDRYYTAINFMATPEQANKNLDMSINASNNFDLNITWSLSSTAGTISGEEMPIIARTNIKEHRDSLSCEKFNFRLHHNITFYVYVSNFSWPIKIQDDDDFGSLTFNSVPPLLFQCFTLSPDDSFKRLLKHNHQNPFGPNVF